MKNIQLTLSLSILLLLHSVPITSVKAEKQGAIQWISFEELLQLSAKQKKKVFIDVYTDWCGWCKVMDAKTFSNPKIADYINKKYYAVKLDAESMRTFLMNGQTISERQLATEIFKVSAFPTTVYLDEELKVLLPQPGYLDVPTFDKIIKYFGEDHYKKQSWEEFEKSYKPIN